MENFGKRLKDLRIEHGLSQKNLANALNYTQSNISEWENGTVEPKLSALQAICQYFSISADYFIDYEKPEEVISNNKLQNIDFASKLDSLHEREKKLVEQLIVLLSQRD